MYLGLFSTAYKYTLHLLVLHCGLKKVILVLHKTSLSNFTAIDDPQGLFSMNQVLNLNENVKCISENHSN